MVRWLRWHWPPDTGFEIRFVAVWGRARYLSVTEAPHNTNFHTWMGKKQFCFFQTAETGNRTPDSGVKGSCANHYPRAPARCWNCLTQACIDMPSKHKTFVWLSLGNGGPASKTLGRRCINVIQMSCVAGQEDFLSNIVHSFNAGSMFGQCRRRWPSIKTALDQCPV